MLHRAFSANLQAYYWMPTLRKRPLRGPLLDPFWGALGHNFMEEILKISHYDWDCCFLRNPFNLSSFFMIFNGKKMLLGALWRVLSI